MAPQMMEIQCVSFIAALNTAAAMGYATVAVFIFHKSCMLGGVKKKGRLCVAIYVAKLTKELQ